MSSRAGGPRKLRVALVGAGWMASKHARVISESNTTQLSHVIDLDVDRARRLASQWGGAVSDDHRHAAAADAVVVATTSETHAEIAAPLLLAGVPVLVEKPLATSAADLTRLHTLAVTTGTPLMCGFVERFNPAVQALAEHVTDDVRHVSTQRYSPPNPRASTGVIDDLLIHDLDLVLALVGHQPVVHLQAANWAPTGHPWPESSDVLLTFPDGVVANLSASRVHQRKVRNVTLATSSSTCEVDLVRRNLTLFRNVFEGGPTGAADYRAQTVMDIPFIRTKDEPLALQLEHFVRLIADPRLAEFELATLTTPHMLAMRADGRTGETHVGAAA